MPIDKICVIKPAPNHNFQVHIYRLLLGYLFFHIFEGTQWRGMQGVEMIFLYVEVRNYENVIIGKV